MSPIEPRRIVVASSWRNPTQPQIVWVANWWYDGCRGRGAVLRVLTIVEVKSVPYAPVSHSFIERLIGAIRREYLDRAFFWNAMDLNRKLVTFQGYRNAHRVHCSLAGQTPAQHAGAASTALAAFDHSACRAQRRGPFQTPIAA